MKVNVTGEAARKHRTTMNDILVKFFKKSLFYIHWLLPHPDISKTISLCPFAKDTNNFFVFSFRVKSSTFYKFFIWFTHFGK